MPPSVAYRSTFGQPLMIDLTPAMHIGCAHMYLYEPPSKSVRIEVVEIRDIVTSKVIHLMEVENENGVRLGDIVKRCGFSGRLCQYRLHVYLEGVLSLTEEERLEIPEHGSAVKKGIEGTKK